jgi:phosphoenolpyruvate synthase/pyruvate phosphate dikinase
MQRGLRRAVRDHGGLPVTIRLLDPPLHEFLPHTEPRSRKWRAMNAGIREQAAPAARA